MVRFENIRCRHREFPIVIAVWLVDNVEPLDWFENQLENEVSAIKLSTLWSNFDVPGSVMNGAVVLNE